MGNISKMRLVALQSMAKASPKYRDRLDIRDAQGFCPSDGVMQALVKLGYAVQHRSYPNFFAITEAGTLALSTALEKASPHAPR